MKSAKSNFRRGSHRPSQSVPEGVGMDEETESLLFDTEQQTPQISIETGATPAQGNQNSTDMDDNGR